MKTPMQASLFASRTRADLKIVAPSAHSRFNEKYNG
jgi:hypothetical protein